MSGGGGELILQVLLSFRIFVDLKSSRLILLFIYLFYFIFLIKHITSLLYHIKVFIFESLPSSETAVIFVRVFFAEQTAPWQ